MRERITKTTEEGKISYDSTMDTHRLEAELAAEETPEAVGPIEEALASGHPQWQGLCNLLHKGKYRGGARTEAATKLILNHEAVLRDVCKACPCSQLELARVQVGSAKHADMALREVARRLLKHRPGADAVAEEHLDPLDAEQVSAWATAAKFLDGRIQASAHERPGRDPDMSAAAATAMRQVLQEIWWASWQVQKAKEATPRR